VVEYAASSPGNTLRAQSGARPRQDGSIPVKDGSATKTSTSPSPAVVPSADVPNVEKNVLANFPPPPRKIRRRWFTLGHAVRHFVIVAVQGLFVLMEIAFILVIPIHMLLTSYGTQVVATVDQVGVNEHSTNGSDYQITYHYFFQGQLHSYQQEVALHGDSIVQTGQQVPARVMPFWGGTFSVAMVGDVNRLFIKTTAKELWFPLIANTIILWIWLGFLGDTRRVVREGTPVMGARISKRISTAGSKLPTYLITFRFKTSQGVVLTNEINASLAAYKAAQVGTAVTVLYDPARPKQSVAYELCNYEVVDLP